MTSSGPGPSPVGIPMPQSEGAKDMLALRGPRREAATHALPRHPSPTPSPGPHVQKHSELGVAVQVTHAPKAGLVHQQPPPSSALMPEPLGREKSLIQGTQIQRGVQGGSEPGREASLLSPLPVQGGRQDPSCTGALAAATHQGPWASQDSALTCTHHQLALPLGAARGGTLPQTRRSHVLTAWPQPVHWAGPKDL